MIDQVKILKNFPIGLLINFGANSLQFKKIVTPKYDPADPKIN